MRVKTTELQEGCILADDVFSKTNRPIIPKKTILTKKHIDLLLAFLIKEVNVEHILVNGSRFVPENSLEEQNTKSLPEPSKGFMDNYLEAVQEYKKEFNSWKSGMPVKISRIRTFLLPLLDYLEEEPKVIFEVHHLSFKTDYLFHHAVTVGLISGFIGKQLLLPKGDYVQLALAGCLADCGMAKIDYSILQKTTSLTSQEYEEVKKHPIYSYKMVQDIPALRTETKIAILQHHERLDGSGYPLGVNHQKIHAFAEIIAVADIFHAMTSERIFKNKQSLFKVIEMIYQDNFGKIEINAFKVLEKAIITYTSGSKVKLSDGQTAEILFVDEKKPTRPLIKLLKTDRIIDLDKNRQIYIEEVID